jgi:AraC-like DNA-binding protein
LNTILIPGELFEAMPEGEAAPGVRILKYDSLADTIVRSKVVLQQHLFSLLVEGKKAVHAAEKQVLIDPSQFLLLSAGHYLMTEKTVSEKGGYQSILLFFDQQVLAGFFARYPDMLKTGVTIKEREEPFLVFTKDAFLSNFIQSLSVMLDSGVVSPELQQVKLEELLLYLCSRCPQQMRSLRASAMAPGTDAVIRQLAEMHVETNITIEELAFLCNMSLSTFKRKFSSIYHTAPSKWFLQQRMERAAALLRMGNEKPSDVYYKVGYESHSSFTHSFKQVFGVTPSEYQQAAIA